MTATVVVAGTGLAELTCARLLAERGHRLRIRPQPAVGPQSPVGPQSAVGPQPAERPRPLLLSGPTLELIGLLWPQTPELLDGAPALNARRVSWGPAAAPRQLSQPARVVDGAQLADRMLARLLADHPDTRADDLPTGPPDWTVTASGTGTAPGPWTAGRRHLLTGVTPLAPGHEPGTAHLDCTEQAWLHLTPLGDGTALLQAMVPGPVEHPADLLARLLADSTLGSALDHAPPTAVAIPAAPRLHLAPASPGRLLVGAGAIRYDPLSGTGTAQALRTAVLGAAVIDAADTGTSPAVLCRYYGARLHTAFREHLRNCDRLYSEAFHAAAWHHELDAARTMPPGPARPGAVAVFR